MVGRLAGAVGKGTEKAAGSAERSAERRGAPVPRRRLGRCAGGGAIRRALNARGSIVAGLILCTLSSAKSDRLSPSPYRSLSDR